MADVGVSITVEGAIMSYAFGKASKGLTQGGAKGPKELVINTANDIVKNVTLWGEADVKSQLYKPADWPISKHGVDTGRLHRAIRGHLVENLHGEIDPSGVRYAIYVEKGNGRGFHGYNMFAQTTTRMNKKDWGKVVRKAIKRNLE